MLLDELNNNFLQKEEKLRLLREKKQEFLSAKKEQIHFTEEFVAPVKRGITPEGETKSPKKPNKPGCLSVTVACNTAWFCDSYGDVLTDKAYDESIAKRGNTIPHIVDHMYSATSHVGDVQKVYTSEVELKDLGYNAPGKTTVLLMDSIVKEEYNPAVYTMYLNDKINQHSIGLRYQEIALAMNSTDESDKEEFANWNKYYPSVINKDTVDKNGYFFVISKADIKENSAVLFGANPLTPTLYSATKSEMASNFLESISPTFNMIGGLMTLEEALAEIDKLKGEKALLTVNLDSAIKTAIKTEQNRVLGILKAAETLGVAKSAETFIAKGVDVELATSMMELVKEGIQKANPSPAGEPGSTVGQDLTPGLKTDYINNFLKAVTAAEKDSPKDLFKGVN